MSFCSGSLVLAGTSFLPANEMSDSFPLYASNQLLLCQERLKQDGYLLLKGLLPRANVLQCRAFLLELLEKEQVIEFSKKRKRSYGKYETRGKKKFESYEWASEHVKIVKGKTPSLLAKELYKEKEVNQALEHENLKDFFTWLFQTESKCIPFKWIRAVAPNQYTGVHTDRKFVMFPDGSQRILTAWVPLGDVSTENGSLLIANHVIEYQNCELLKNYNRQVLGADGTHSGWISHSAKDLQELLAQTERICLSWSTVDFNAGDVCIIGMDSLHQTLCNQLNFPRLSADTRWQPSEDPIGSIFKSC